MKERFWVHIAELQKYRVARNAAGQPIKRWETGKAGVECYIRALNGAELTAAEKAGYIAAYRMYCGKDVDIKISDRIVCKGTSYEITFINNQISTHLQIDLKAVE